MDWSLCDFAFILCSFGFFWLLSCMVSLVCFVCLEFLLMLFWFKFPF